MMIMMLTFMGIWVCMQACVGIGTHIWRDHRYKDYKRKWWWWWIRKETIVYTVRYKINVVDSVIYTYPTFYLYIYKVYTFRTRHCLLNKIHVLTNSIIPYPFIKLYCNILNIYFNLIFLLHRFQHFNTCLNNILILF